MAGVARSGSEAQSPDSAFSSLVSSAVIGCRMQTIVSMPCHDRRLAGAMPGEPVFLGLMGVTFGPEGPPCGVYVGDAPESKLGPMVRVRAKLYLNHPSYLFHCTV
jgi:hypothetical protein